MNKNNIASVLRDQAMLRSDDDALVQLLLKAAQCCDALSVDAEVARQLHDYAERKFKELRDLPDMIASLRAQILELHVQMKRYVKAVEGTAEEKTP
jgi:lipopolysaccharide biosynthesis regulator YciM